MPTIEEFPEHFASLATADRDQLFQHLPTLESATDFGNWKDQIPSRPGVRHFPFVDYSHLVMEIHSALYNLGLIINYDWGEWKEGQDLLTNESFSADGLSALTICKLITGIVRNDRFCEGVLLRNFKNGKMKTLLKALEREVKTMGKI